MRFTSFSFALQLSPAEEQAAMRHAGAARFAYNQGLAMVNEAYRARQQDPGVKVPYSGFDLINTFNRWKLTADAGVNEKGRPGLPWRGEVLAQVFEESLVDLSRGLKAFFDDRKAGGRKRGFPKFKKRQRTKPSFRVRNKKNEIRVEEDRIRLPKLGELKVRESTRRLRRLRRYTPEKPARAKVLFATVSQSGGRWFVRLNVEAQPFHESQRHPAQPPQPAAGIDRGLHAFAVCATANGHELWRDSAPKPLANRLRALQRMSRRFARCKRGSKNRLRLRRRLARLHARIGRIRKHYVHNLSSQVIKTHSCVAIEDLHVAGMLRNHCLARHIADVAWSMLARQIIYKGAWYNSEVVLVDRFFPSSKTCHRCFHEVAKLPLSERIFRCPDCGLVCDRDTNAAANCARFADSLRQVAVKHTETENECRGEGSGRVLRDAVQPASMTQERLVRQRDSLTPVEGGVGWMNVNTL